MKHHPGKSPPSDFTVFTQKDFLHKARSHALSAMKQAQGASLKDGRYEFAFDELVHFAWRIDTAHEPIINRAGEAIDGEFHAVYRARSLVCLCFDQSLCSATLRLDDETPPKIGRVLSGDGTAKETHYQYGTLIQNGSRRKKSTSWSFTPSRSTKSAAPPQPFVGVVSSGILYTSGDWQFRQEAKKQDSDPKSPYLFSADAIIDVLFPAIFHPQTEHDPLSQTKVLKSGLIIISGQTGTLKSTIVRGLLRRYLGQFNWNAWGKRRYPHILTLEDPIERPLVPLDRSEIQEYIDHPKSQGINFTPRQIGKDVRDLASGLKDALRQTPAAVIVGETRDRDDWRELLKFASTGHLCITTSHAGSLVETMRTIIEATDARTPDLRSSLVEKIVAVAHLRTFDLTEKWPGNTGQSVERELGPLKSMLLPAIWRNVSGGSNFFVSDGLSAILPRRAEPGASRSPVSCRGRSDFARTMLQRRQVSRKLTEHVARIATRADLEGV